MALPLPGTPGGSRTAGQVRSGRTAADFDDVYRTTYRRIFRTLASMLGDVAAAEDCTQDAFVKAFRAWPTWKQDAPVEAWLHRIAINTAISYRRAQAVRDVGRLVRQLGRPVETNPADQALGGELLAELRRLPPRQAAAIVLRYLHGYTNREIAAALDVPESTVATRLMTARRTLQARLGPVLERRADTSAPRRVPPCE
jgi:RNA polymerase sigma-70 factor (ECF subfamily)